jgi:hypothetical protein
LCWQDLFTEFVIEQLQEMNLSGDRPLNTVVRSAIFRCVLRRRDIILLEQHREVVIVFGTDVFWLIEARAREFARAYSCKTVLVFQKERSHVQSMRLLPQIGRLHQAQNAMTTSVSWSRGLYLLLVYRQHDWIMALSQLRVAAVPFSVKFVAEGCHIVAIIRWPCQFDHVADLVHEDFCTVTQYRNSFCAVRVNPSNDFLWGASFDVDTPPALIAKWPRLNIAMRL